MKVSSTAIAQTAGLLAAGIDQRAIAKEVGISQTSVSKIGKRDDIKSLVEKCQTDLISKTSATVVDNHVKIIKLTNDLLTSDSQAKALETIEQMGMDANELIKISDKKEARIGQAIGIFPAHAQSQTYISILNQVSTIISDPVVLRAIGRYADDNVIDVELGLEPEVSLKTEGLD